MYSPKFIANFTVLFFSLSLNSLFAQEINPTQPPIDSVTFRTESTLVQIPVRAKGGSLRGKTKEDLVVSEDGKILEGVHFDKTPPVFYTLLFASLNEDESTFRDHFEMMRTNLVDVHEKRSVRSTEARARVLLNSFGDTETDETTFSQGDVLSRVVATFRKRMRTASSEIMTLIIVTDGLSTFSEKPVARELRSLAASGQVIVFTMTVGNINRETKFLTQLAELSGGAVIPNLDWEADWNKAFQTVYDQMDQYHIVSFPPLNPASRRWRTIRISLKKGGDELIYRPGYCLAPYCRVPKSAGYDGPRDANLAKQSMRGQIQWPKEGQTVLRSVTWKHNELELRAGEVLYFQDGKWSQEVNLAEPYQFLTSKSLMTLKPGDKVVDGLVPRAALVRGQGLGPYQVQVVFNGNSGSIELGCGWPQSIIYEQSPKECTELTSSWAKWGP